MDTRQTLGQTLGQTLVPDMRTAVRWGAALLWAASAVWTTVSIHHVIDNWITSGVVTALVESAYALATVWFHHDRSTLATTALVASLVPVVAALAIADRDMFGPVGFAFAAGPIIAEGGFLLAAHLGRDLSELSPEQQAEIHAIQRDSAHRAALRQAELEAELADIKAGAVRQMALNTAAAQVRMRSNDLTRQLSMSVSVLPDTGQTAGQTDKVSEQVTTPVRDSAPSEPDSVPDMSEVVVSRNADMSVRSVEVSDVRLSIVGSLSEAVRSIVAEQPGISNADLTARVSELTGKPQKQASVQRTRSRQQPKTA